MGAKQILMPFWQLVCQSAAGLEGALMPRRCVFCGLICRKGERLICPGCDADLPRAPRRCPTCAQTLGAAQAEGVVCADCQVRPTPFEAAMAPLAYEFPVDAAIRMFKFRRRLCYAPAFGELLQQALAELSDDIDALLPVPLHWIRHGVRGFNQAAEMCRPIRKATGLPLIRNVYRVRATPYQLRATRVNRR
jgi:predicted amidophosphoribosyltransferase